MAVVNPPYVLQAAAASHPARLFRRFNLGMMAEGVGKLNGANDMLVTNPSGTIARVAKGFIYIKGTDVTDQGIYGFYNDANLDFTLTAPGAGTSRIDAITARIKDNTDGTTAGDTATIEVVAGVAGASPVPPAIPTSSYRLANVTITSASVVTVADTRTAASILLTAVAGLHQPTAHTAVTAIVFRSAAHNHPNTAGGVTLPFDAEEEDTFGFHAANASTLIVPAGMGGVYAIQAQVVWTNAVTTGTRIATLRKNSTSIAIASTSAVAANMAQSAGTTVRLVAGDTIDFLLEQNTAGSLALAVGRANTHLSMIYVGA